MVVAPLPLALRSDAGDRPRRGADVQVSPPLTAMGGELARRPKRSACVFLRTSEVEEAELALQNALVGVFVGERADASPADVAEAIVACYDLPPEVFSVHRHGQAKVLIYFTVREDRNRVLDDQHVQSPYFRLLVKPWSRRSSTTAGGLCVHVNLEIEGVPANAWSMAAAETILVPISWVERLDPLTCSRADMGTFRLSAWFLDPALIPREVDFHLVEPDEPPSARTMAAPSDAIIPPHIPTLCIP